MSEMKTEKIFHGKTFSWNLKFNKNITRKYAKERRRTLHGDVIKQKNVIRDNFTYFTLYTRILNTSTERG